MPRPAVFLDRDDTINRNADLPGAAWAGRTEGDLLNPEFVHLIAGSREALIALKRAGFALVVITNQGGLARGGGTTRDVEGVHDAMRAELDAELGTELGVGVLDACYYAPHHPRGVVEHYRDEHPWRKPGPGMIDAARRELDLDLNTSWMVGDKQRDLDAAVAAGIDPSRTVMVGPGARTPDLRAAAARILGSAPGARTEEVEHAAIVPASRVTLRAPDPSFVPMRDARTRDTVGAVARAIAERTGVALHELAIDESGVEAVLGTHKLGALAFMSELRRDTNHWHERQFGTPLWDHAGGA